MDVVVRNNVIRYVSEVVNSLDWGTYEDSDNNEILFFEKVEKLGNKVSDCDLERIIEFATYDEILEYISYLD